MGINLSGEVMGLSALLLLSPKSPEKGRNARQGRGVLRPDRGRIGPQFRDCQKRTEEEGRRLPEIA
jgi:hypothetical protein